MSDEVVLKTTGLGKRYGKRWAVRDLSLEVHRGDIFGFLGPNGAGKSTTIRMILSLISPTTGTVSLFGQDLRSHRRSVLARVGGLVESADFYLYLSGRRNLEIVGALRGGASREAIDEVLDIVSLLGRADDRVKTYSHGMKQRLGIAQALLGFPELVILDEPTLGLDPQGIKEVRELIRHLSRDRGMTIFLSSHLLHEIEQTATSMAIINEGDLVVQGSVASLLSDPVAALEIDARPLEAARQVAERCAGVTGLRVEQGRLLASVPADRVGELTRTFVMSGIDVRAIVPRRTLEEYFLSITEGATDTRRTLTSHIPPR